jgi:hypothetical protein
MPIASAPGPRDEPTDFGVWWRGEEDYPATFRLGAFSPFLRAFVRPMALLTVFDVAFGYFLVMTAPIWPRVDSRSERFGLLDNLL